MHKNDCGFYKTGICDCREPETPTPQKYVDEARKKTAWLMNPVEIDHSDPIGEAKARYKQAEDMAQVMALALFKQAQTSHDEGVREGLEEAVAEMWQTSIVDGSTEPILKWKQAVEKAIRFRQRSSK